MAKLSQVAIMVAPSSMLLQILAAWPLPGPPAWITALPMAARIGWALAKAASVPPTMKVSVPPLAAAMPPETGASTISNPAVAAASLTRRAVATSIVEQSSNSAPGRAASNSARS